MTAPVAMTDAIPLLAVGGTAGVNNSKDIRRGLLQSQLLNGAGGFVRQGVIHRYPISTASSEPADLKVLELAAPGQAVRINGGFFVVHRGKVSGVNEGPYLGFISSGPTQVDLPAASGANARYDLIVARVWDKNIAADSALSTHGPYFDVISGALGALDFNGTRGAAGALPVLPDGCLELAAVARAVSDNTVSQAEITDMRRGTTWGSAPRVLFPFDIVNIATDTGYQVGEMRLNAGRLEIWEHAVQAWRPESGLVGGRSITGGNNLGAAVGAAEAKPTNMDSTLLTLAPNRRYRILVRWVATGSVGGDAFVIYIKQDTATAGTAGTYIRQQTLNTTYQPNQDEMEVEYETGAAVQTRAFKVTAARISGTGTLQFAGGGTPGGGTNYVGVWVYDVGPAGVVTVTAS